MNSEILDQVRTIIADVLSLPAVTVTAESSPQTVESWDSVHHLNLVLALEEKFSVQFSPEEIDGMRDVGEIAALVQSKTPSGKSR